MQMSSIGWTCGIWAAPWPCQTMSTSLRTHQKAAASELVGITSKVVYNEVFETDHISIFICISRYVQYAPFWFTQNLPRSSVSFASRVTDHSTSSRQHYRSSLNIL